MATLGKSIRVYLKDGTVTGIKFGEVVNQTIQSISCPRLRASELFDYPEAKRPGVYFLFGHDEETNEPKVYIGEAENICDRIKSHIANKEFWNEVLFFISKDENLTKSHVKYLESRLIQISLTTKRYKVENINQAQLPSLPIADKDAMEEFLIYLKLLLGVFGHKLLEEVTSITTKKYVTVTNATLATVDTNSSRSDLELFLSISNLKAKALQTEEGIVVLKGSEASKSYEKSLTFGYRELRDKLISNNDLSLINDKYVFQNDVLFDTASPAAAIIVGYSINGPQNWKDANGKSLKEIESTKLKNT